MPAAPDFPQFHITVNFSLPFYPSKASKYGKPLVHYSTKELFCRIVLYLTPMPEALKSTSGSRAAVLLVEYPDSPRYEVRVYRADIPHDHRTLIATDNIREAETIYCEQAARL